MDNKSNDLEDVLLDIFVDNHVNPSNDWSRLPVKDLKNSKQHDHFLQKRLQSETPEKDKREEALAKGLFINNILTLAYSKRHLEKSEYIELLASTEATIIEHVKGLSKTSSAFHVETTMNRNELSPFQEAYLIYLADIFGALLELKNSLEDGCYIPKEAQSKIGVSLSYGVIGGWQRRHIKWQAAAQVFWLDNEANTKTIRKKLLCPELLELLGLEILPSVDKKPNLAEGEEIKFRNLEDLIRKVNPRGIKKGRPRKNASTSLHTVFIPLIYDAVRKEINTEGLHIAIDAMARVLRAQKTPLQEIINHPIIHQYKSLVPLLETIVNAWILSAFKDGKK